MYKSNQTLRLGCALFAALTLASVLSLAGPPWKGKDPSSWTAKEVEQVLTSSPWAQSAVATFTAKESEVPEPIGPPIGAAQAGLAGSRGVTDGHWDGGVGRNISSARPTLTIAVRWDSALPVREALKKSQAAESPAPSLAGANPNSYVLTVVGLIPAGHYQGQARLETNSSSSDPGRNNRNPEQALEGLMTTSLLRIPGKKPLTPEDVKFDSTTGSLHLYFPRTQLIDVSDKEAIFITRFGSLYVEKHFRLKEMTYKGALEL